MRCLCARLFVVAPFYLLGTLPSIPSEGAINQDTSEDKEICGYLNDKITEDLPTQSTAKVEYFICNKFVLKCLLG